MSTNNTIGGKLKLKGPLPQVHKIGKKKKIKKSSTIIRETDETTPTNTIITKKDELTETERRYKERQMKKESERINNIISKSHKEKIEDYNKYLSNLSEHHDIPKVGPG